MLGPKRPVFKPTAYGSTRRQRRVPRWLVLILTGIALGAGGLLFLQSSYGPSRLTVEQSEQLHYDLSSANTDKQRLQTDLTQTSRQFEDARREQEKLQQTLEQSQAELKKLKADLILFADAMPPDPRGTSPGIRAASFTTEGALLDYSVLLMQEKDKTDTFNGTVEFVAAGRFANGRSGNIDLPSAPFSLGRYHYVEGQAELPEGFKPRQITVRVKGEGSERVVATRTLFVNR